MKVWIWAITLFLGGFFQTAESLEISPFPLAAISLEAISKPQIDLKQVFSASPFIYSLLILLSVSSLAIWLQTLLAFRKKAIMPPTFLREIKEDLSQGKIEKMLLSCQNKKHLIATILTPAIQLKDQGIQIMLDSLKAEGKRASISFWQKLSLLQDITVIAPMLGLLGTVIGMFYAFYDINRSVESITSLFDGLGIAVGTTVVGLIVALFAMMLSTTLKHKLIKTFSLVENEAIAITYSLQKFKEVTQK